MTFKEEGTRNSSKKVEGPCLFSVVGINNMAKSNSGTEGFISAYRLYVCVCMSLSLCVCSGTPNN